MPNCNGEGCGIACRFILFFLGFVGLIFTIGSLLSCEFYKFENDLGGWIPGQSGEGTIGLFRAEIENGECQTYPDGADFDGWMVGARATGLVAGILSIIALCFLVFECVCCKVCGSKICLNLMLGCAFVSQACTFLVWGTEDFCGSGGTNCSIGNGAIFSIVALSMYLISSCVVCCAPKPEPLIKGCCKKKEKKETDNAYGANEEEPKKEPEQVEPEKEEPARVEPEPAPVQQEPPLDPDAGPAEEGVEIDHLL